MPQQPSIFLMGCVNGGTSIIAKLYQTLGWHYNESHEHHRKFMEVEAANIATVRLRNEMDGLPRRPPSPAAAIKLFAEWFASTNHPTICKDHRFSFCMDRLSRSILDTEPNAALVWLKKDITSIAASIRRRRGDKGWWWNRSPEKWIAAAAEQYQLWPGQKWVVQYESVRSTIGKQPRDFLLELGIELWVDPTLQCVLDAQSLFDVTRGKKGNPHQGKDGWQY